MAGPSPSDLRWSGSQCVCEHVTARGVWVHGPPEILGNLEAMRFASETIFGPIRYFSEAIQQNFTCMNIHPFAHCVVQHWFRLSDRLLILHATHFADETNRSLERRENCWKTQKSSFALFATIS